MKKYWKIMQGVKIPWILILLLAVVYMLEAQVAIKTVKLTADIIDGTSQTIDIAPLIRYLEYMALTVGCYVANQWLGEYTFGKIRLGVRDKLCGHIFRLPMSFYDTEDGNELVSRVTNDCDSVSYYFEVLINTFGTIYQAVLIYINLFSYNKKMGFACLIVIPISFAVAGIYGTMTFQISRMCVNSAAVTTGYLFERTMAFRMIKAYNTQEVENKSGQEMFRKIFHAECLSEMTVAFIQLGMQIINVAIVVIAFVFGSRLVAKGVFTIGELVSFYSMSGLVGVQLINLFLTFGTFTSVNGAMKKVAQLLMLETEKVDGDEMEEELRDLLLEQVDFGYEQQPVLQNLSLTIPKDTVTAIVGTNGAGKSTVFKLLQRMYEPQGGSVCFGERNANAYSLKSWREHFAVVTQEAKLVSGTIRENLCYGVKDAVSEETLVKLAQDCGIYDYIQSQEKGFDSEIVVGSTNLSGGQKQTLAIMRAILKNSPYLLLDEATRSLDAESECMVEKAIEQLTKNRTTIMIAHNPSAIRYAKHIIVLKDGAVEDFGTKEELMERNTYFKTFIGAKA